MTTHIDFKITDAGQTAAFNASHTGFSLNLTHIAFGTGNKTPDGRETGLVALKQMVPIGYGIQVTPTQIRMMATFSGSEDYDIKEVGVFAGSLLVCYWSQASGKLTTKFSGVDFVFSHDMVFGPALPDGSLNVSYDNNSALMVAAVTDHISGPDPHPQYLTQAEADARYPLKKHLHLSDDILGGSGGGRPLRTKVYSTPGTFNHVAYPGATYMEVHMVGGGGGGTVGSFTNFSTPIQGLGGGGGCYVSTGIIAATSFNLTVGAGGAGNGGVGGNTFTSLAEPSAIVAIGGTGTEGGSPPDVTTTYGTGKIIPGNAGIDDVIYTMKLVDPVYAQWLRICNYEQAEIRGKSGFNGVVIPSLSVPQNYATSGFGGASHRFENFNVNGTGYNDCHEYPEPGHAGLVIVVEY